jgi:hypothetical protein
MSESPLSYLHQFIDPLQRNICLPFFRAGGPRPAVQFLRQG